MALNKDEEFKLAKGACDKADPTAKNRLWEYLHGTYYKFLLWRISNYKILPDTPEDVYFSFLLFIMEEGKLCGWRGDRKLSSYLAILLNGYIVDELRRYAHIEYEKDQNGKIKKDEYGEKVIKKITYKRPLLHLGESLSQESQEDGGYEENVEIYKIQVGSDPLVEQEKLINEIMLKEIKAIQKEALLKLSEINQRDAEIIRLVSRGIPDSEIQKYLGIENYNTFIKAKSRAYGKYTIIFNRILKEEKGIESKATKEELKESLKSLFEDSNDISRRGV